MMTESTMLAILKKTIPGKLFICLLPLAIMPGCSHQDRQAAQVFRPVKVVRIEDRSTSNMISFAGEVKARYETTLSFRVPGKLAVRQVDIGDVVSKGQVLAKLDPNDYRLAMQSLKAQLASATADRNFLRDDLARYRELLTQQVISPPEFDRHQTAYITTQERVAALEAQLGQAVNALDYTELRADRNGVVTGLEAETGQFVSAGQTVVQLAQLDEKEIRFDVPEHRLPDLERTHEATITLWADGNRRFKARIREIAPSADRAGRTFHVKATLLEGLETAQLGMTATVWIPSNKATQIAIPLSSVFTPQDKPEQTYVWLVNEPAGTVKSIPIQVTNTLDGERVAVTGLAAGQLIVSAGVQRLAEGQAVRLPEATQTVTTEANRGRQS